MLLTTTKSRFKNSILIGIPQPDTDECLNGKLSFDENGVCTDEFPDDVQILLSEVVTDLQYVKVEEGEVTPPEPITPPIPPAPPAEPETAPEIPDGEIPAPSVAPEIPVAKTIEEQKAETRASLEALGLDQLKGIAVQSGMHKNVVNKATKAGIIEFLVAKVQ